MAQSRLQQLIDHLFATSASALVLESNTTGVWLQAGGASLPAFRQPLRTGQILLLLSDVVPKDQSTQLLSGTPTRFTVQQPQGEVAIHITLTGDDVRAEIIPVVTPVSARAATTTAAMAPQAQTTEVVPTALMVLLGAMAPRRATHLHLSPGRNVFARIDGQLQPLADFSPWSSSAIHEAVVNLAPIEARESLRDARRVKLTHLTEDSIFHLLAQQGAEGYSLAVRCVPRTVPSMRALHLPPEMSSMRGAGVWLIAGGAKQGRSSTLASFVQSMLLGSAQSVLMLEEAPEHVLRPGNGLVQHRALEGELTEVMKDARLGDFDVIAFSSLDDSASLGHAVRMADQGRMVVGVVHADTSVAAMQKWVSCSGDARSMAMLRGVFAQKLIKNIDGERSLLWEYLPVHEAARAQVRAGSFSELASMRSHSFDDSLCELVRSGSVELTDALEVAEDQQQLRARVSLQSAA